MAFELLERQMEYFLPLYTKVMRRKDNNKPRKSVLPLFPGYICFNTNAPHGLYSSGRVVNLIQIRHQKRFLVELSQIEAVCLGKGSIEPYLEPYEAGEYVRILCGPMMGVVGMVTRGGSQRKLVLSVEGMGRALLTLEQQIVQRISEKQYWSSLAPHRGTDVEQERFDNSSAVHVILNG